MSALSSLVRSPRALGAAAAVCVVAAAVVLIVALSPSGGGGGSSSLAGPRTSPLQSIFESDVELHNDPAGTLALFHRLGVGRARVFVSWGPVGGRPSLAPDPFSRTVPRFDANNPAAYDAAAWAPYDAIVRAANARGIGLDFTLAGPAPLWAEGPGEPAGGPFGDWEPNAKLFGEWVHAIATRYSGHYPDPLHPGRPLPRVDFWAIWNEPNFGIDLAPQATDHTTVEVSPRFYRAMVDAAWSALQATGHGHDTILIGELSPKGQSLGNHPANFDGMVPLRFVRALYCVDQSLHPLRGAAATVRGCPASPSGFVAANPGLFHAGGFSDHPYPQTLLPDQPTPNEPDFADLADIPNLIHLLDQIQTTYGQSTRFPIYNTEYGYLTSPPEKLIHAFSPPQAAGYLNWAEYLSWHNPRIASFDQYLLHDPAGGNFPNGLLYANGRPKPGFFAWRFPLYLPKVAGRAGQPLEVWGCARPSVYIARPAPVKVEFRSASGGSYRTLHTVTLRAGDCYFDLRQAFPGSGSVRLAWTYPGGPEIFSRTVPLTLR